MPDGDILYGKLNRSLSRIYKMLCQGQDPDYCARTMEKYLLNQIKKHTSPDLLPFLGNVARLFADAARVGTGSGSWNHPKLNVDLERLLQNNRSLTSRDKAMVKKICDSLQHTLRYGSSVIPQELMPKAVMEEFLWNHYKTQFKGNLPLEPSKGPIPIAPEELKQRRKAMEIFLMPLLEHMAVSLIKTDDVKKVRKQANRNKKAIDMNEDLQCIIS
jgi:hypothetical protein